MINFSSLDFLWRFLVLATVTAAVSYSVGLLVTKLLKNRSPYRLKWFQRGLLLQITLFLMLGFLFLAENNPLVDCFQTFASSSGTVSFTRWLGLAWLTISGILLSADAISFLQAYRLSKAWRKEMNPRIQSLIENLKEEMQVKRSFSIWTTDEKTSPFVFGLFEPRLVLPQSLLKEMSSPEVKSILAHEIAHIKDGDSLWACLEHLLRRILFFLPLVMIFKNLYYETQEMAADEKALRGSKQKPSEYARHFLKLIESYATPQKGYGRTHAISSYKSLKNRIMALEKYPRLQVSWFERVIMAVAILGSTIYGVAEARNSIVPEQADGAMMCLQIEHEMVLQKILHVENPKNKCE